MGYSGLFFLLLRNKGGEKYQKGPKFCKFAAVMQTEKVQVKIRIDVPFYDLMAKNADRRGMTVAQFTRYILKKYFNDHAKKQTNTTP
jgi:hypothetical protein